MYTGCRGIIIKDDKLVVMEREKNGRKYCVFPGGHLEKGENPDDCVKRELMEEFGIVVKPIRILYGFKDEISFQAFYLLEWQSGEIHRTDGEEYQPDRNGGIYNPTMISLSKLQEKNLVPPEVTEKLLKDIKKYGRELNRPYIEFAAKN